MQLNSLVTNYKSCYKYLRVNFLVLFLNLTALMKIKNMSIHLASLAIFVFTALLDCKKDERSRKSDLL